MGDTNGQVYWNHSSAQSLCTQTASQLVWDGENHALALQPSATLPQGKSNRTIVDQEAAKPRIAVDTYGTWAFVDDEAGVSTAFENTPAKVLLATPPASTITDLDWTHDGHLIITCKLSDGTVNVLWHDTLKRFDTIDLSQDGFAPDRIAAPVGGGLVWLVDRIGQQARFLTGTPIPDVLDSIVRKKGGFSAKPIMADPPRIEMPVAHDLAGEAIIEAVADANGDLILLRLDGGGNAILQRISAIGERSRGHLSGVLNAHALASFGSGRVAIACHGWREARVFAVPQKDGAELTPLGFRIPLRDWTGARFCSGASGKAYYPTQSLAKKVQRLSALSYAAFARQGETILDTIDCGADDFVWHRLYLEGTLPQGTSIDVFASAANSLSELGNSVEHRHRFGMADDQPGPIASWIDADSERPWAKPAGNYVRARDRCGLFSALVQRSDEVTDRRISGRYLKLRLVFSGPGNESPSLNALRVWGPRYSWRDRHLPELYRQSAGAQAAGSDFLERYLALFEGLLTPIEGEIATLWRLANPLSIPADGLDWLASWLGIQLDDALGESAQRRLIANASRLASWRGTLRGLSGMLDLVSGGGVSSGRIVIVEHHRMQRTFATILGADFSDTFDPLTRGSSRSGQSTLGPGFFLGQEDEKRLFALFMPQLAAHNLTSSYERAQAAQQLTDMAQETAHRVTVLVHDETDADRKALLERITMRESPAHVIARTVHAPGSLLLGLTALLGIETRLAPAPRVPNFQLGQTLLGQARLASVPTLDNRI